MRLTDQEIGAGLVITRCTCCGHVYKTHMTSNACAFSLTPGFGCHECQGESDWATTKENEVHNNISESRTQASAICSRPAAWRRALELPGRGRYGMEKIMTNCDQGMITIVKISITIVILCGIYEVFALYISN